MSSEELVSLRPDAGGSAKISIVGIGGAGSKLLGRVILSGSATPHQCVAVNSDRGQLSHSPAQNKVLLGNDQASLGFESSTERILRRALQLSAHRVMSFVESSDVTILIAGFGGETGTLTTPVIAQRARTQVKPVVAVVAMPFIHEREKRFIALRGLKRMVEACDCTILVDNAMGLNEEGRHEGRLADSTAVATVRGLADALSRLELKSARNVMKIMMLGPIATVCVRQLQPEENIGTALVETLRVPSARLPLDKAQGAILIYTGPVRMGSGHAAQAHELLSSMIGRRINFAYGSIAGPESRLCLLLTGYDYDVAVNSFVELLTELYDVEYEEAEGGLDVPLDLMLYQMEGA